jgi:hypothetical protein
MAGRDAYADEAAVVEAVAAGADVVRRAVDGSAPAGKPVRVELERGVVARVDGGGLAGGRA